MTIGTAVGVESTPIAVDVVILGAGINGAALARELVLNGLSVIVVDADDIAAGTTRWSTRLVHGGLRYLEYGELALVRESLAERNRLLRLAPHLVRPLGFVVPVRGWFGGLVSAAARILGFEAWARRWAGARGRGGLTVACGLWLYDLLSTGSAWPRRCLVRGGAAGMPAVDAARYPLAGVYDDAQMIFPERFTVELLVDARTLAAEKEVFFGLFTRRTAHLEADGRLRVASVAAENREKGSELVVVPRAIVNATGAWVDHTLGELLPAGGGVEGKPQSGEPKSGERLTGQRLTGQRLIGQRLIGGTKGSHLLVDHAALREALGGRGVYAEAADGRPVFVLPFGDRLVLVGTTDIPFAGDPSTARTDADEIDYLVAAVRLLFPAVAPSRGDVVQHYCGVRPLPARRADGPTPAGITRRHMLVRLDGAPLPLWSIVGGKLTTCRSLAEGAAVEVLAVLGLPVTATSKTRPLPGACSLREGEELAERCAAIGRAAGVPDAAARSMAHAAVGLFGARAGAALGIERTRSGASVADREAFRPLGDSPLPRGVVGFCLELEWAETLADIVERRLLLAFDPELSMATLRAVAGELVRAGRLAAERSDSEIASFVAMMAERYGKRLKDQRLKDQN
jgi:glycerol-3-phosphate dehydrogenase